MSEDKDFFERLSEQYKKQDKELTKQEPDEDFFEKIEEKHEDFFKASQEPDEEFFERVDQKHRAFFEEDDSKDKSGSSGSFFVGGISRPEVIEEVQKDGMFLEKVADRYGDDIEIVSLAVGNNANAYAFASKRLRENGEVAQLFIDTKKADIEEAKLKSDVDSALIDFLQNQIQIIFDLHERALQEKEHVYHQRMSI